MKPRLSLPGSPAPIAAVLALLAFGVYLALTVNGYYVFVLAMVALLAIVGIGLNVLLGLSGQISFGHVGFYALGAYTVAILTSTAGWSFWLAWPLGALIAAVVGGLVALPALRVRGPYLAMLTIAFGFIVEHSIVELRDLTGGQNGIMGIGSPSIGFADGERAVAVIAIAMVGVLLWVFALISRGTWGAAMRAVRDNEIAAESVGINPVFVKTAAFVFSAALAGLAGGLFSPLSGFVTPHTFNFSMSILFVLAVMIGGSGTIIGPAIGAIVVGLLPEFLASLEEYRLLFFGGLLLVVLWVAPTGAVGMATRLWRRIRPQALSPSRRETVEAPAAVSLTERERAPLLADGLTMVFGGLRAASNITLAVRPGVLTSLIGPNGAGKSTVINMLTGFYRPSEGEVRLKDAVLNGAPAWRVARAGVARTYQTSLLFGSLDVLDNVALAMTGGRLGGFLGAGHAGDEARARAQALLDYCGYRGALNTRAADLPHVDRRLVEIARALATDPDVLLLDEPAAGLSREDKAMLATLLTRIARAGIGVLVVEHDMPLVMGISDHVVVIDAGQPLAEGTPAAVQANPAVRQAYLGEGAGFAASTEGRNSDAGDAPERLGINALTTGYGAAPVLHEVDLQVRRGELVALLGANGAGKSTLMRALAGLHRAISGGIHLDGSDLGALDAERVVRLGLILVPEGRQVFPELSVLDNIRLGAFRCPEGREARVEEMLDRFPRLRERAHQRAGLLSGGEQQMLAIARGLMARPEVLLLDEPSLGLAPKVIEDLFAALDRLRREKMTILLVDQMASLALALADRAYVLEGGRVVASGTAGEIAADTALADAYLGGHG
ncbi:MAG: branched-chain amino acid ABC transporter ATP-binding protein/permease [Zoogloeaceae bacterium]|nr:branched-chain amino acid ABC transporter ATP-binding protein/permease [Zoogloeaceae bacterium]